MVYLIVSPKRGSSWSRWNYQAKTRWVLVSFIGEGMVNFNFALLKFTARDRRQIMVSIFFPFAHRVVWLFWTWYLFH